MLRTVGKHSPNDTSSHTRKSESSCTFLLFSRIKTWNWFVFPFIKVVDVIFFQQSENGSVEAYKPYSFLRQWHFEMTAELATRVRSYYFYWLSCFSVTYTCVYAVATEHSYCCTRLLILLMSYCRISKFVNFEIRVFDICDRFFFIPVLRPFVTGFYEPVWDHVASESVFPSLLLLRSSLSAHWSSVFP